MEDKRSLILTGWGPAEYVASAAAALKALDGRADVRGVSRRRLPELLWELADARGTPRWTRIYLLGVSLGGDPDALAAALERLKATGVRATWISALEMPKEIAGRLDGLLDARVFDASLLEAVGRSFGVDVEPYLPFLEGTKRATTETKDDLALIATAQFYYRNYQDESLYATAACYLANGVKPCAWAPDVKAAVAHYDRYGGRELLGHGTGTSTRETSASGTARRPATRSEGRKARGRTRRGRCRGA